MLDHMVEGFRLHQSDREQYESTKGSQYYQILQMEKGKRDARLAIVTLPPYYVQATPGA